MKKILVIFTGGTIGSKIQNSTIDVDESTGYFLINNFTQNYKMNVEFDTIQPINMLSENCTPGHWQIIYDSLKGVNFKSYDGIIITHGSDTLPYTSALLGYLFPHTEIPIVITGSNYALEEPGSNGLANFYNSVSFILYAGMPGVYAVFQNNMGKNIVYLATRLMEADSYNDEFNGFGRINLGEIVNGSFKINKNKVNPTYDELSKTREAIVDEELTFHNPVLAIKPYPGLNYGFFNFNHKPKAILHSLYHSGTACTSENEYSLPDFVKKCRDDGIDFYLISFKNISSNLYVTSRKILENGAVPLQNISFEAALAKLSLAYNQGKLPPSEFMKKEIYYEFLPY